MKIDQKFIEKKNPTSARKSVDDSHRKGDNEIVLLQKKEANFEAEVT